MSSSGGVTATSKCVTSDLCACLGEIMMARADHRSKRDVKATYIQGTAAFNLGSDVLTLQDTPTCASATTEPGRCQCQTTRQGSCLAANSKICAADVIHISISGAVRLTIKMRSKFEPYANVRRCV